MNKGIKFLLSCMLVVIIAMSNVAVANAEYCEHVYDGHRQYTSGYIARESPCWYKDGEINGKPIYVEGCTAYDAYRYCDYICLYCGQVLAGQQHSHNIGRFHTVYHTECMGLCN